MKYNFQTLTPALKEWKYLFALFVILLIAYFPVASFQFALKNDAFIYNFPNKFFFSESLKHNYIPWWNPYLNYGFPIYADPGFAWWHPITWMFGLMGYNAYTFTIEVLVYLYISGVAMYWLARQFAIGKTTAFIMGCMFMCCGFFIGNLQHINFITCAAFLPFVVGTWFNLQKAPSIKKLAAAAIAAYLLCTGGHPAIPIATVYFMLTVVILYVIYNRAGINFSSFLMWNSGYILFTILLLSPALYSWYSLLPHYIRSETVNQQENIHLGFTLPSYISFISPFSTIKNPTLFDTDVSMRNAYYSLFGFCVTLMIIFKKKTHHQKTFLIAGLLFLLFSAGGITKQITFTNLPLLQFIRANGEFRVFALLSFIVAIGYFLQSAINEQSFKTYLKRFFKILFILLVPIIFILIYSISGEKAFIPSSSEYSVISFLKNTLDNLSFLQSLMIGLCITAGLSVLYYTSLKRGISVRGIYYIILFDIIVNTWLLLPITGVGKTSVTNIHTTIRKSPKDFPDPSLFYKKESLPITSEEEKLIGNWGWYSKEMVHVKGIDYPSGLKTTEKFLVSADTIKILKKTAVFTLNQSESYMKWSLFTPNKLSIEINLNQNDTLIILQNNFPGWKAKVNSLPTLIYSYAGNFISIPVTKNSKIITLEFSPFF
ncbi:MAG: hypothetical protein ABR502_05915 [Chitinophagaceae bacterium]